MLVGAVMLSLVIWFWAIVVFIWMWKIIAS
jgi:hypothetical protein